MTADDLAGLPEEARRAFRKMDRDAPYGYAVAEEWQTVRAELLRLAAMEHAWQQWIKEGMRVEFLPPELPK